MTCAGMPVLIQTQQYAWCRNISWGLSSLVPWLSLAPVLACLQSRPENKTCMPPREMQAPYVSPETIFEAFAIAHKPQRVVILGFVGLGRTDWPNDNCTLICLCTSLYLEEKHQIRSVRYNVCVSLNTGRTPLHLHGHHS